MILVDLHGLREWALEDGRLIDPAKPGALGLCIVLGCYEPVAGADGCCFCKDCRGTTP